jgi:hypothetical protein
MPQARVEKLLVSLRDAVSLLDFSSLPAPTTPLHQFAHETFGRLRSQICAVVAVATADGIDGSEVEVIARPLLEAGITVGWVGRDEAKVSRLRDHMRHQGETWMREFMDAVNGRPLSRPYARHGFPSLRARAKEAGRFYARSYAVGYTSMSAATHGLADGLMKMMQPGLIAVGNALRHALTGVALVVFRVGDVFDSEDLKNAAFDLLNRD